MEIPRHWRLKTERERFATKVVLEGNDWKIVEGFGNSLWVISKIGDENFMLPSGRLDTSFYAKGNGHSETEDPLKSGIIYQAPIQERI